MVQETNEKEAEEIRELEFKNVEQEFEIKKEDKKENVKVDEKKSKIKFNTGKKAIVITIMVLLICIIGTVSAISLVKVVTIENELKIKNQELEKKISNLEDKNQKNENAIIKIAMDTMGITLKKAYLNANEKGYGAMKSLNGNGDFLISIASAEKYLSGYKVTFNIAPLMNARYINPQIRIIYGKYTESNPKTENVVAGLIPGIWNSVDVILDNASDKDMENIAVSITADTLSPMN